MPTNSGVKCLYERMWHCAFVQTDPHCVAINLMTEGTTATKYALLWGWSEPSKKQHTCSGVDISLLLKPRATHTHASNHSQCRYFGSKLFVVRIPSGHSFRRVLSPEQFAVLRWQLKGHQIEKRFFFLFRLANRILESCHRFNCNTATSALPN